MLTEGLRSLRPAKFQPRILECLKDYGRERFLKDVMAGIAVGIVALSLCIGLGVASGVSPLAGLFTGVIGGFCVSFFGGSRVQIGGPAGAFVGMIYMLVTNLQIGLSNVLVCTMLAGVILFVMGLARVGSFIRFVPQPVTAGFTCGIAVTILLTQVRPFLGLDLAGVVDGGKEPAEFFHKIGVLAQALPTTQIPALVLGAALLAMQLKWPAKWGRFLPGSIVTVILGTLAAAVLHNLPWTRGIAAFDLETIGSVFPDVKRTLETGTVLERLPKFALPAFDMGKLNVLVAPAFSIAILCAIESLLSAVVADGIIDDRHDSNQELMGQGIANILSPLFGGIAVTGVIARTATNIRSGGTSPVAGVVHAVFLLLVLLFIAPLALHIPLVALAVVLIVVGWRMGDWEEFRRLPKRTLGDASVFLTTFALTVCLDLTVAVEVGMILAAALFVKRVADTTQVRAMSEKEGDKDLDPHVEVPRGVIIYRLFGALLFGAADRLDVVLRREMRDTKVVILQMQHVSALDATALDRLENMREKFLRNGRHLVLCGPHTQPYALMEREGFIDLVGRDNVLGDIPAAVARARELLGATA
ncbi:MAG: STAS domain-containing protein [Puniceicoccales bacterium]|jgi:SulP family sulfate permease|nr:STAS domain-containing protein [Puniceicoccales bacterium]